MFAGSFPTRRRLRRQMLGMTPRGMTLHADVERNGMSLRAFLPLIAVCAVASAASAKVYSPWVLSEHVADTRDEVRFAADPRWADLKDEEKALAVWRYLTDPITGTWHFADTSEGNDPNWESRIVKDPVKDLNVYGYAVCTVHACLIEGLYEALGFPVRQMAFGGYHRTAEVEWAGRWRYLDVDERAYLLDKQGEVAGAVEATTRRELWERSAKAVSPFYPQNGGVAGIRALAEHGPPEPYWHWRTLGHTMDFALRPGESLIRYWQPQGYWRVDPSWTGEQQLALLRRPPAGPKTAAEVSANNSYGNGKWTYQPTLAPGYRDFAAGVYRSDNVRLYRNGLGLAAPGKGWAEWRVRTPYIIVGQPHDLTDPNDDSDAAVVEFVPKGKVTLRVSIDQGRTWQVVWSSAKGAGPQRIDLTKWVVGRYEYHVRFDLTGSIWNARVSSFRLTTWTQLAPASLPRLRTGVNHLTFTWGDRHHGATEMLSIEPDFSDPADLKRWGVQVEGPYDPLGIPARARGQVTLRVRALAGTKIRWLHVGGSFDAHHEDGSRPDRILYSAEPSEGWRLLRAEDPPAWTKHWYYNLEADLELNLPVTEVWVRLDPAVGVNGLRVYAHCAPDNARQGGPVVVTHTFREDGKPVQKAFRFTGPRPYQIDCRTEPENVSIKMHVASQKVKR
jgi:hypothetical protein